MVIVETWQVGKVKGPRLLVDLRNNLIFMWTSDGEWVKVPTKGTINMLRPFHPLGIYDTLGILEGLYISDCFTPYKGPHPEPGSKCMCGANTNEYGLCPRCHHGECHVCGKPLTDTKVPSGEGLPPRIIRVCSNPRHNPTPIPHWRTKPIEGPSEQQVQRPKKWPVRFQELPVEQRKVINNFFANLMGIDRLDQANWEDECKIHKMKKLIKEYKLLKEYYHLDGPLAER